MSVSHILGAGIYTTKDYDLAPLQQLPVQMDSKGNIKVTGSNIAPQLATYVFVTDGTHTQPTLDEKSRGGYIYLTDGTNTAAVNDNNALKVVLTPTPYPMTASAIECEADRSFVLTLKYLLTLKNTVYNVLYLNNPLSSGKRVYVRKISVSNVTSANLFNVTINTNPTITILGTPVHINNTKIGSVVESTLLAYNGNTVTSNNGTAFASVSGSGEQNQLDFDYGVILLPNNAILVQATAFDNNQTILVNITWAEV